MTQPQPRSASTAILHALMRLLPADMRDRDGDEIEAMIADEVAASRRRGRLHHLWFIVAAAWDLARRAPYEHWRRRGRRTNEESPMRSFIADLRFAVRSFSRQPGPTALIVLTLTLGVAANTAVFAIVDGLFLRPFPFPHAERLVYLNERAPVWNLEFTGINYPDFHTWRQRVRTFDAIALWAPTSINLADGSGAERATGLAVTYDFPKVLGIQPVLGRSFTAEEDGPTQSRVIVIGHGLWQTRFAGSRDVIGKALRVNSVPYTIIGVLPPNAEFPGDTRFWIPLNGDPNQKGQSYSFDGLGRLKPGITVEQARADLEYAHAPVWAASDTAHNVSPRISALREQFVSEFRVMGKALGAGAVLVLLIACANVAGAMLARSIFRRREVAIRMALGASARRVGRQLITESLVLAVFAGVAGTILGRWTIALLAISAPGQLPPWVQLQADARTIGFAAAVVLLTALVFGLAPAMQPRRADVAGSLAWGGGGTRNSAGLPQRRMLDALVIIEIALALVLLAGSGLLVRAYGNLRHVDPGFRADGVTTFQLSLPRAKYANGVTQQRFFSDLVDRLSATPGVEGAGIVSCLPFGCHWGMFVRAEGAPPRSANDTDPVVLARYASPGYFRTMGIQLLRGRFFAPNEGKPGGFRPVVINEQLAKQLWPNVADPIGRRMGYNTRDTTGYKWMTVVGVVRDVRHYGLVQPMRPGYYLSTTELDSTSSFGGFGVAMRSAGDPAAVAATARSAVRAMDPEIPLIDLQSAQTTVNKSIATRRTVAFAFAAFGAVALALALGGIYAVLSYVVGRRRQEIGIRMALGARRGQVLQMVVRQGLRLVAIGVVIGLPLALLAAGSLSSLLVDVSARDPLTYVGAIALLAGAAVLSALIPARRAAGVDPKTALGE
ncbi:MAG TPA: ABC transporter permease [Gemmatimonadaceae bacterium]|nr:ABC transporter permease [Gemmatimonadaceae bacterium]